MLTNSEILEAVAEAIRQARRSYTKPLDNVSVRIVPENLELELDIVYAGKRQKLFLVLEEQDKVEPLNIDLHELE